MLIGYCGLRRKRQSASAGARPRPQPAGAGFAHLIETSDIFAIVLIRHKYCLSPIPRLSLQVTLLYEGPPNAASKPDFTEELRSIDDDLVHRAANGRFG
jgi:hypothetical protein